ncbi:hypothetical protein ACOM2C_06780 [Pseudarthrobacter sp. So.54]
MNTNDKEFPVTHFLKMGAVGFGGFNGPDVVETKSINSVEGRFQNGLDVYRERVSAMGPWGYLAFLDIKGKAILGDGTFFTWGEGMARQPVELVARDPVSKAVQDYFYYDGPHFAFLRAFWQSLWFATLLLVAAPLLIRGRSLVQLKQQLLCAWLCLHSCFSCFSLKAVHVTCICMCHFSYFSRR